MTRLIIKRPYLASFLFLNLNLLPIYSPPLSSQPLAPLSFPIITLALSSATCEGSPDRGSSSSHWPRFSPVDPDPDHPKVRCWNTYVQMCWVIILGWNYCPFVKISPGVSSVYFTFYFIMTSHREKMYIEKIHVPLPLPSLYFTPNSLLHLSFNSSFRTVAIIT